MGSGKVIINVSNRKCPLPSLIQNIIHCLIPHWFLETKGNYIQSTILTYRTLVAVNFETLGTTTLVARHVTGERPQCY